MTCGKKALLLVLWLVCAFHQSKSSNVLLRVGKANLVSSYINAAFQVDFTVSHRDFCKLKATKAGNGIICYIQHIFLVCSRA
jgi:hypothetical protein